MALTKVRTGGITADAVDNTILDLTDDFAFTGTVSGTPTGMDMLLANTTTSPASSVDFSNTYLNSTYDTYLVIFRITPSTDNVNLFVRFATDGSTFQTGAIYAIENYRLGGDNGAGGFNAGSAWQLTGSVIGNSTGESINGYFYLVGANNTAYPSGIHGFESHADTNGNHQATVFSGAQIISARDGVVNGLRFVMSSGNIENSEITIYGLDKN